MQPREFVRNARHEQKNPTSYKSKNRVEDNWGLQGNVNLNWDEMSKKVAKTILGELKETKESILKSYIGAVILKIGQGIEMLEMRQGKLRMKHDIKLLRNPRTKNKEHKISKNRERKIRDLNQVRFTLRMKKGKFWSQLKISKIDGRVNL
ncbi:hypothetical protein CR513_33025, partial [Mucuna pruriens]